MPTTAFLPALSSIVNLDDLPENLQFIETGIDTLLDDIYFRALQYSRSDKGDEAFYSLVLVLNKKTGFTIPGTEMELVPTGLYLALDGLTEPLHQGESFEMHVEIEPLGEIESVVEVEAANAKQHSHAGHAH